MSFRKNLSFNFSGRATCGKSFLLNDSRILIFGLLSTVVLLKAHSGLTQSLPTASVLSEGGWHQVAVVQDGVYRLDRSFLEQHGIITSADSLSGLHVYGNGNGMLPQANDAPVAPDLRELAVWISPSDDFLLFYGQGPDRVYYDTHQEAYRVEKHLYDTANYYFLTHNEQPGRPISTRPSIAFGSGTLVTERLAVYHHQHELTNLLGSGRQWWGEELSSDQPELSITFSSEAAQSGTLEVSVGSRATSRSTFDITIDGTVKESIPVGAAQNGLYGYRARVATQWLPLEMLPDHPTVTLRYHDRTDDLGYLDYLTLNTREPLVYRQRPLLFSDPHARSHRLHRYQIKQASASLFLWDITNPQSPVAQTYRQQDSTLSFRIYADTLREFITFDPATVTTVPRYVGSVANQDLRSLPTSELLIITAPSLREEAERLAAFRREHDGLTAWVVTLPQIYNEFSSGRQDVTAIRNFIRMRYRRDEALRYVLLFGDASYDYRSTQRGLVPTYQSRQSLHSVHSYASDDYFGFMDNQEGEWPEQGNALDSHDLELGIGRLPVRTPEEARVVVDKLIHYGRSPQALGKWRKDVLFVADDGDANKHQHQSDFLASQLEIERPDLDVQRLFLDAFPQEDNRAPAVRQRLDRAVERGVLLVDFIGHGGETAWTNEQILDLAMIEQWDNYDRLPVFLTATCEFGRFDDPQRASGAETALLSETGGAIALFTTTRPAFANTNFQISTAFYEATFPPDHQPPPRLGDIIRDTKNRSRAGTINRNFVLLGDPSMTLRAARQGVAVISVTTNGTVADTLRPLDRIVIEGQVMDQDQRDVSFSGTAFVDFLAQPQATTTLGQEDSTRLMTYRNRDHSLFRGSARVVDGTFTLSFILPKNTPANYDWGKLSFYALDKERTRDASGAYEGIVLGGEPDPSEGDQTPPTVELFFNRERYPVASTLYPHSTLIVRLADESGINIADETHGIRLTLDDWQEFTLNDTYEADLDNPQRGKATFVLPELVSGQHTLRITAADTYLNTRERTIDFAIVGDSVLLLQDLVVYPNPTEGEVNISFEVGNNIELSHAELVVYTALGKVISQQTFSLEAGLSTYLLSDVLASSGAALLPGTYLYQLTVVDTSGAYQSHRSKLLVHW